MGSFVNLLDEHCVVVKKSAHGLLANEAQRGLDFAHLKIAVAWQNVEKCIARTFLHHFSRAKLANMCY